MDGEKRLIIWRGGDYNRWGEKDVNRTRSSGSTRKRVGDLMEMMEEKSTKIMCWYFFFFFLLFCFFCRIICLVLLNVDGGEHHRLCVFLCECLCMWQLIHRARDEARVAG